MSLTRFYTATASGRLNNYNITYFLLLREKSSVLYLDSCTVEIVKLISRNLISEWNEVKYQTLIVFDFDNYPIQLKTNSAIGSGDAIDVVFYVSTETDVWNWTYVGNVWIKFTDPMTYRVLHCVEGLTTFNLVVPEEINKIWEFVKTTADLRIICNSIEVLKIEFDKVLNSTFQLELLKWRHI